VEFFHFVSGFKFEKAAFGCTCSTPSGVHPLHVDAQQYADSSKGRALLAMLIQAVHHK
jgi:hypothetical protein